MYFISPWQLEVIISCHVISFLTPTAETSWITVSRQVQAICSVVVFVYQILFTQPVLQKKNDYFHEWEPWQTHCAYKICFNNTLVPTRMEALQCGWVQVLVFLVFNPGMEPFGWQMTILVSQEAQTMMCHQSFWFWPLCTVKEKCK